MSEKIATREAYGKALVELGASNDKIVVLDADLAGATMTKFFKAAYPDRFFDCGIAECNICLLYTSRGQLPPEECRQLSLFDSAG